MTDKNIEEIILPSDPRAAKLMTVTGWVSRNGRFYGTGENAERIARYDGSTVNECRECGSQCRKNHTMCDACTNKNRVEKYLALPEADVPDGYLVCHAETYASDLSELIEELINDGISPTSACIYICKPNHAPDFNVYDHLCDVIPSEDDSWEAPEEILEAAAALNKALHEHGRNISWTSGTTRPKASLIAEIVSDREEELLGNEETK